ncbi:MAG TPA: type I polyketide synthase, partial [Labilithrix sp.]|nr:type I polyketide synthase [Labilithrix sp.]
MADAPHLRDALRAIVNLEGELARTRQREREPIAIVGLSMRSPFESQGVAMWEGLARGIDASREIPGDRWATSDDEPASHEKVIRRGSFLSDVMGFDARFFAIAPVEAQAMDPQQRMMLEIVWESIADAGAPIRDLQQLQVGVFLGVCANEYSELSFSADVPTAVGPYLSTGGSPAVIAGRASYALGLTGPSLVVDTACSSSLVAVHLACESLRVRTSDVAIAGGVNLIVSPRSTGRLAKLGALSADGRCRTFDATGSGFGRGEGGGVVVLKRLSDAVRDGDRVLALVRGSAVNQDGRSDGLTAPSGPAQQRVVRSALEFAKLTPGDVQYVEAHGTGTVLGDPIEVEALNEVFGAAHSNGAPLAIGSVKSNIGHLEGAAGISGLIKTILCIQHRQLPASLHFDTPNPHIPWEDIPLRVQTKLGPWPAPDKPLIAGVSSFGLSGTNSHVVVSEPPATGAEAWRDADRLASEAKLLPLCVSAKTPEALRAYAKRFAEHLTSALEVPTTWRDVAFTSTIRRTHLEHRLVVVGGSAWDWSEKLVAFANGETRRGLVVGEANEQNTKVVFVFPGQGSQWLGMGKGLLESSPVFREHIERCEQAFRPHVDWSLREQLVADVMSSRMGDIDVVQPMIFAVQTGLAAVWGSLGVVPDAVVGHSMGEVAASFVAGALSLEDAARVICVRSKLLRRVRGRGAMAAVELSMAETEEELAKYGGKISVAASNGARSTVVSGESMAITSLLEELKKREIFCRLVKVDVASHSSQVDELKGDLSRELAGLRPMSPSIRFVSTCVVDPKVEPRLDAGYWWSNLREPVRLSQRVEELIGTGHNLFVEVSPHPVLTVGLEESLRAAGVRAPVVASLRREEPESEVIQESLGALHAAGYVVDWRKLFSVPG